MEESMTIEMLDEGAEFIITRVRLARETGKRLADMGFTEGVRGFVVRRGFLGGPFQIRVGSSDVMIRSEEAAGVEVEAVGEARMYRHGSFGRGFGRGFGHGRGLGQGSGRRAGRGPGHGAGSNWNRHDA
ncbi:MAG: ferrous iron transport protein A, partial [Spirochaetales bacterium]|nr:ferrous iron transport protein A [Spirochaetales bacterium]